MASAYTNTPHNPPFHEINIGGRRFIVTAQNVFSVDEMIEQAERRIPEDPDVIEGVVVREESIVQPLRLGPPPEATFLDPADEWLEVYDSDDEFIVTYTKETYVEKVEAREEVDHSAD